MSGLSISHSHIHQSPFIKQLFVFAINSAGGPSTLMHLLSIAFWMSGLDYPNKKLFCEKSFLSVFKIFVFSSIIIKGSNWSAIHIPHLSQDSHFVLSLILISCSHFLFLYVSRSQTGVIAELTGKRRPVWLRIGVRKSRVSLDHLNSCRGIFCL